MPSPTLMNTTYAEFIYHAAADMKEYTRDSAIVDSFIATRESFEAIPSIKAMIDDKTDGVKKLQKKSETWQGWSTKDAPAAQANNAAAGNAAAAAGAAANHPGQAQRNFGEDRGPSGPNRIDYFDNAWPGAGVDVTDEPFSRANLSYPPKYIAGWKKDDERIPGRDKAYP